MRDAREPRQRLRDGPEGHAARPAPGVRAATPRCLGKSAAAPRPSPRRRSLIPVRFGSVDAAATRPPSRPSCPRPLAACVETVTLFTPSSRFHES